jgi:hypothetical protein
MVWGEIPDNGHVLSCLFITVLLDEIARRLILEEGQSEDETSKHDV